VFLSYSHADADRGWVRAFAESLRKRGVKVWFDEFEVKPGEPLVEAMEQGLRASDSIVFVMTPESVNRPNVFFEIGAAIAGGKRMVAIVSKDLDPSLLPQPLRTRRFLPQGPPEQTADELVSEASAVKES
jgi:ABC-type branched-subunit amino acid transport system substrate-binding protein